MSPRAKTRFVLIVGTVLLIAGIPFSLWLEDVRSDRKHTVVVNSATPVFVGTGGKGACQGRMQLTTVERGSNLPVRRIRYLKGCAALDVALPDGRQGYIVLGVGDVSVIPPLPRD
jgi:hypothetical protein